MASTPNNHLRRAVPIRPPASAAEPTAPRRPMLLTLLGAAALVAVSAAATAVLVNQTAATRSPAPPAPPATKSTSTPPAPQAATAPTQPPEAPRSPKERLLAALGSLSAAQAYQGYLNIGLLADGVESEAYTKAEAEQMLTTVGGLIDLLDRQLERVSDLGLDPDDQKAVERVQRLAGMLRRQAEALRSYWTGGDPEQILRYHGAREAAWLDLSHLLGIQ